MQIFYTNYFKYFAYGGGVAGSQQNKYKFLVPFSLFHSSYLSPSLSVCLPICLSPLSVCLAVCLLAPKNSYLLKLNIYICVFVQRKYVSVCACVCRSVCVPVCEAKLFYGVCLGQTNSQAELESLRSPTHSKGNLLTHLTRYSRCCQSVYAWQNYAAHSSLPFFSRPPVVQFSSLWTHLLFGHRRC